MTSQGSVRVAVVLHVARDQPWSAPIRHDLEAVLSARPEIELEFANPEVDAAEQVRLLEGYLDQPIAALVLLPIDPELVLAPLARFRDRGVPVIVLDHDLVDAGLCRAAVLADNRGLGRRVGELFVDAMRGAGGVVEITGQPSSRAALDRSAGFREALAGHPGLRILESCAGHWTYEHALAEFTRVLSRHRRIDGVFAQSDEMARAALDAAAAAGREQEMLVTGIDALPAAIRLVGEGRLAATFLNPSPGKRAGQVLMAVLDGEPCLPRVLLHTSPLQSHERIRAWREARPR